MFERACDAALVIVAAAAVLGWLLIALTHVHDRYRLGHVQGHWMALARYATVGTLYPPLADGQYFGGTRHMPLPILVNAAAARATGEFLVSGKVVAIVLFSSLLVLLFITMRQVRCPTAVAVGLCGLLPATNTGVLVGSTPGGDVLPVVLQLAALLAAGRARGGRAHAWIAAAGVLAGLAAASKLTGIWAALAILSWLAVRRDWRRISWCAAAVVVTLALTFGAVEWASGGRFLQTLRTLALAGGSGGTGWVRAPSQLAFFGIADLTAVWMLAPFAAVGVLDAVRRSVVSLYHHALAWSLVLTLVVFTDVGAGLNQLLDPAALTLAVVGALMAAVEESRRDRVSIGTLAVLAIVWAGASGVRGLTPDLRVAAATLRTGETPPDYDPARARLVVSDRMSLLTEDPGLPVLLGRTPVVLDAFMLRRLDERFPALVTPLVERIDRREFDRVALIMPLEEEDTWWRDYHFGPRVVAALRTHYALAGRVDRYFVYQPRRDLRGGEALERR